jgi:hypothetical protein
VSELGPGSKCTHLSFRATLPTTVRHKIAALDPSASMTVIEHLIAKLGLGLKTALH